MSPRVSHSPQIHQPAPTVEREYISGGAAPPGTHPQLPQSWCSGGI